MHEPHQPLTTRRQILQRLLAATGLAATAGCADSASRQGRLPKLGSVDEPAPIRGKGYKLVKDWDFARNITSVEAMREEFFTRYIYNNGQQDALNDEWERYRDNDNHVFEDGTLALVARTPEGAIRGKIESGMIRSKWSGQYGYFEASIKVPDGRGMWPAFWLNPQDGKWPPEIDILEMVNNGRDTTRNTFHFVHSGVKDVMPVASSLLNPNKTYKPGTDFKDDFHTYSAEWLPDRVRHYVDDVLVVDREFKWVHRDGSDGGPAHVLVNLAVGGAWPGRPDPAAFPAKLKVKYVRVWQR
jgi:beta-glucanase (GH16 family)